MKFSKMRQLFLVSAIGLMVATLFTGCQLVTIDYLFVATSASTITGSTSTCPNGEIETYAVDSQVGRHSQRGAAGMFRWNHADHACCLTWKSEPLRGEPKSI